MPVPANLVWETSTITGTGNFTSLTTVIKSFNTAFGTGGSNLFEYFVWNAAVPGEYEHGLGHLSASTTLVRDTVLDGSNGTSLVNFSAGIKNITNAFGAAAQQDSDYLGVGTLYAAASFY